MPKPLSEPRPGDLVHIRFGSRVVEAVVTSVRGNHLHVSVELNGAEEPIDQFIRADDLVLV